MKQRGKVRSFFTSMSFLITASTVLVLLSLCIVACVIGYYEFTDTLTRQYNDAALHTAMTAKALVNADEIDGYMTAYEQILADIDATSWDTSATLKAKVEAYLAANPDKATQKVALGDLGLTGDELAVIIDEYLTVAGKTANYKQSLDRLNILAAKQNTSVVYIIRPTIDYTQYYSIFNSPSPESGYTAWLFGTLNYSNQNYIDIYRDMDLNNLESSAVVRDQGLNGAKPHITSLLALRRADGSLTAVICVQRFMDELNDGRHRYTGMVFSVVLGLTILLAVIISIYFRTQFVRPIHKIVKETQRFGAGGDASDRALQGKVSRIVEISNLAYEVCDMEHRIAEYTASLTQATAERERISTELSVATQIQESTLPHVFPNDKRFELYAMMKPAKEVGGDFYDFFLVDDDHLALVMADVSGKGVPAALMMMISDILVKERALLGGDPVDVVTFVNKRICANNKAEMFVTMWVGMLELSTGKLLGVNAGHDDPAYRTNGGDFVLRKDKHGMVVGAMDIAKYRQFEWQLKQGDTLILYTDGLPEATDGNKQMYRVDKMLDSFNRRKEMSPKEILEGTWQDVCEFVGDAPQFDDLTMLCIHYEGPTSLEVDATDEALQTVLDYVDQKLDCDKRTRRQLAVAVEEIFVNIAHYAYPDKKGKVNIQVDACDKGVAISFADSGIPYNPLEKEDPDVTLSAEEREIGGLGVFMVKKIADRVKYEYVDGQNRFTMEKDYVK